jgi:hypothetical protein
MRDRGMMTWVLETDVFGESYGLPAAAHAAGHRVVHWNDDWWQDSRWPELDQERVIFHGSLGNASRIAAELPWRPGAFCDTARFHCSAYYPSAARWLLNRKWAFTTVAQLVEAPAPTLESIGAVERFFVRPDSPLKPFSGRVVDRDKLSLEALDHGFYYDDQILPIVVAPVATVDREWRYVVVAGEVVAGSAYQADGRTALPDDPSGEPWRYAASVASILPAPQEVYVLDICESGSELRLLELNPFSGADLYACDAADVAKQVAAVVAAR